MSLINLCMVIIVSPIVAKSFYSVWLFIVNVMGVLTLKIKLPVTLPAKNGFMQE